MQYRKRRTGGRWAACAGLLAAPALACAGMVNVAVSATSGQPLADAVLMLEPTGAKAAAKPLANVEMGQENKQFIPQVTVVTAGTKVAFPNRDTVRHHVYSFSDAKKFEIKLYVGRPENPVQFDQPGIVVLGCNIHDTMVGWIVVTDTPWFAKTAAGGRASLGDVPPGSYRLRTWHPELPMGSAGVEQAVTVGTGPLDLTARLPLGRN